MKSRVIKIKENGIENLLMDEVIALLKQGGVIGYPTETVYGLGGDAFDDRVVERLNKLKGRKDQNPFLLLVAKREDIYALVQNVNQKAKVLMNHFWPGPLTLVFYASSVLPEMIMGGERKVGLRLSPDPVCRVLLKRFKSPIVSTSANPSGRRPAQSADQILRYFGNGVDLILDGGPRRSEESSTVLDVSEDTPRCIREGVVPLDEIKKVIRDVHA